MPEHTWFLTCYGSARRTVQPGARIFCFSHAGGNPRAFLGWQAPLGNDIEIAAVCPPGRAHRYQEPRANDVPELAARAAEAISATDDRPFYLFGHSLGAVVAFEAARLLRGDPRLRRLIASGCSAPSLLPTPRVVAAARLHGREFTEAVMFFGGLPPEIAADEDVAALLLPSLQADFRMVADYRYRPSIPLDIPVALLNGRDDPHVKDAGLGPWERECAEPPAQYWADGGHFYFVDDPTPVTDVIRSLVHADRRNEEHVEVI